MPRTSTGRWAVTVTRDEVRRRAVLAGGSRPALGHARWPGARGPGSSSVGSLDDVTDELGPLLWCDVSGRRDRKERLGGVWVRARSPTWRAGEGGEAEVFGEQLFVGSSSLSDGEVEAVAEEQGRWSPPRQRWCGWRRSEPRGSGRGSRGRCRGGSRPGRRRRGGSVTGRSRRAEGSAGSARRASSASVPSRSRARVGAQRRSAVPGR